MADEKVCSYHEVLLRRSDVDLLRGRHWLNDQIIAFFFEYLRQEPYRHAAPDLLLVDPSATFLLLNSTLPEARALLEPLAGHTKRLVLLPVNNNSNAEAAGGSHWSLLAYVRASDTFYHLDSAMGSNAQVAQALARQARLMLGVDDVRVVEVATPQQHNGYDCGMFVLAMTRELCRWGSDCTNGIVCANGAAVPGGRQEQETAEELAEALTKAVNAQVTQQSVARLRQEVLDLINERSRRGC